MASYEDAQDADGAMLPEVIDLLDQKLGVHLPIDHIGTDTFIRDLCMALHGHPGYETGAAGADTGEDDDGQLSEDYAADNGAGLDDAQGQRGGMPPALMSSRRKKKLSQGRRQPARGRMTPARGAEAATEQLKNSGVIRSEA